MVWNVKKSGTCKVLVGVNSQEYLLRFKSFNKDTFFVILVSLNAIMSKLVREFIRNCAFIRNKDKDLFSLGVLMLFILSMSKYLDDYLFLGPLLFSRLVL